MRSFRGACAIAALCLHALAAVAAERRDAAPAARGSFPADANLLDVRNFGAVGDGRHDDTAALQQAINFAVRPPDPHKERFRRNATLLLPAGTYLVSATLDYGRLPLWAKRLILQGAGPERTIIRLADHSDKFQRADASRPVLSTFSGRSTNQAFLTQINDLTIDVGAGNPGATGLRFVANDQGGLRNVRIRSADPDEAGAIGLDLGQAWIGPALFDQVKVSGFDTGIRVRYAQYGAVFRDLTLERQRQIGIADLDNSLTIDGLTSHSAAPVLRIDGIGFVALARGMLTAEHKLDQPAIIVAPTATLHLVDSTIRDYAKGTKGPDAVTLGPDATRTLLVSQGNLRIDIPPFDLPAAHRPDLPDLPPERWSRVGDFTGEAIAHALTAGSPTVYLPFGEYIIAQPITIPPGVRRIIGFASKLKLALGYPAATPVLTVDTRRKAGLVIEGLDAADGAPPQAVWIANDSAADLLIRDCMFDAIGYRGHNAVPPDPHAPPKIQFEDVAGTAKFEFVRQSVAAWQLKSEAVGTKLRNEDGRVAVVGLTAENAGAVASTVGGQTTIFGGLILVNKDVPADLPAFDIEGGRACLSLPELTQPPAARKQTPDFTILTGPPPGGSKAEEKQPVKPVSDFPAHVGGRTYPAVCSS